MPENEALTRHIDQLRTGIPADIQTVLDQRFAGADFTTIHDTLHGLLTYVHQNSGRAGVFERYKIFASLLPERIAIDINTIIYMQLDQHYPTAMSTLSLLRMRTIITTLEGLVKESKLDPNDLDDAIADILGDLLEPDDNRFDPQHHQNILQYLRLKSEHSAHPYFRSIESADEVDNDSSMYPGPDRRSVKRPLPEDTTLETVLRREYTQELGLLIGDKLTGTEIQVIIKRFIEKKTLDEVAHEIGKSRERVRQIEEKIYRQLRPFLTETEQEDKAKQKMQEPIIDVDEYLVHEIARLAGKNDRSGLARLKNEQPTLSQKINHIINSLHGFDANRSPFFTNVLFKSIKDIKAKYLLIQIIFDRDPEIIASKIKMDYVREAFEALAVLGVFDRKNPNKLEEITLKDVVYAYLSGRLKSTQQTPSVR